MPEALAHSGLMILDSLRQRTRPHHERAERTLAIMDAGLERAAYRETLAALHGFYLPMEARLAAVPALPLDLAPRRKAALLARDLRALGLGDAAIAALPRCPALPAPTSAGEALGCLYVLEGATLGGQVISRHLARTLGIGATTGAAFFGSYGARVGPMWQAFRATLVEHAARHGDDEAIVAAAGATFDAFTDWLERARATATGCAA